MYQTERSAKVNGPKGKTDHLRTANFYPLNSFGPSAFSRITVHSDP